ncbi:porin [Pelomonas aquatica]|jgi:predicted porin|uniref:Porin n=1 Tax=Pelomonas aquatica TaxID=431058 RepID=A0A9X4LF25_9BURK|nr:porin [Pelomonas aquatica]MCY4755318.1 porin [Pelomonas aquatica]MDG0861816.1 porin [Pelomonas aquatica]
MKKIALVAALAAVAAPAFAQSSVTLWGRLNTSVESQKFGNNDRMVAVQNNSSRLGFRGTEDLGGGLKASFNLEHGFKSDTGTLQTFGGPSNTFWSRQANVELSGDFGTVRLGTWFPDSYFSTVDRTSNHNHDTGTSSDALFSDFAFARRTNKVGYFSPTFEGFSFIVSAHAGEGAANDSRAFDLSANYEVAGLHVAATYAQADAVGAWAKHKAFGLESDYAFGPFLVTGYYQREQVDGFKSRDIGRLSAMYTLGQSEFHVNVGGTRSGSDGTFKNGGASQWTLGYNYNLSKRTKVYGFYTSIDYKDPVQNASSDNFKSSLAVGIRHNF